MPARSSPDVYPLWHPFTQMARFEREPQLIVARAEGSRLIDVEGRAYIDGVASLWANVHGHSHPHIVAAIQEQAARLQHSTLLGVSHEPAIALGRRLLDRLPGRSRVFFSENGASAVEVALKMAVQYWANRGRPERNRIAALDMAYHGDTLGAVSVGAEGPFRDVYKPLLFEPLRFSNASSDSLRALLESRGDEIAAVIIEPRVQGAGGILVAPEGSIAAARALCHEFDVLLIADEVATGFGKTGAMFACDLENVTPDITVLGKGVTGGYLPLSATVATEEVYQAFHGEEGQKLFHGHTYAGNPICCAAALASLDLFEREDVLARVRDRAALLATLLAERVAGHPLVGEVRQQGLMTGVELVADRDTRAPLPPEREAGWRVCLAARDRGVFIRPLGDVIVLMPPLSIEEDELVQICEAVAYGLDRVPRG